MALACRWFAEPYAFEYARRLSDELGISHATASILVRRGHDTPDAARRFLAADERHDASLLVPRETCELILQHLDGRIVVHGDYDVDGICATAVLVRALRALGADPRWHLPARADGYGLALDTVRTLAADGTTLLVTVDCGLTAVAEVAEARALGMDVVVTDHHLPGAIVPDCAIVHPSYAGYPCPELCGTAVAHKLVEALLDAAGADTAAAAADLDLVALATVADVVPLRGENRRLVREGLSALARTEKVGLRALMRIAHCEGAIDEQAIGFRLAPRLNAAGRLGRADVALELVICEDEARAPEIADELDLLNRERQDTETRILFAAEAARAEHPDSAAYVIAGDGWHPGVIGIVAGRLVERHHRPCVVIALEGDRGRGSGRSIASYDLYAGLAACAAHLRRFGGHRAAAGLDIDRANVDAFRDALGAHAATALSPDDLVPVERVDAVVGASDISVALADELGCLGPFGHGNPRPSLLVPAARVEDVRAMGDEGAHSRCRLVGARGHARAVAFRTSPRTLEAATRERNHAVVSLEVNEWMGAVEPRLVLRALCACEGRELRVLGEEDFWSAVRDELDSPLERPPPALRRGRRRVCDRRGGGFAPIAADLIASGESVLVVCAEVARRRGPLERILGGVVGGAAIAAWEALTRDAALAAPFDHVVALDPPLSPTDAEAFERAPCDADGFAHLAWGQADVDFARALAAHRLDLRADLASLYRDLKAAAAARGEQLVELLRGDRRHPRPPRAAARLVRVLVELDLVALDLDAAVPLLRVLDAPRTELVRSSAYHAYRQRYAVACGYLDSCLERAA